MRIPHVHKYRLENAEKTPEMKIDVDIQPAEYLDDLGLFEDRKEYVKFVIRTKYMIRKSGSYQDFIKFLKKKRDMNMCGVHPNITGWNGFTIEIHHTPFTLEDIVHTVISKRLAKGEDMKQTSIAREVMELHYLGLVGLYPLCQMCHGYAHGETNDLFIPLDSVFGDPQKFYELYKPYATESIRAKFENILALNKGYSLIETHIPLELQRKYIYVNTGSDSRKGGGEVISTSKLVDFINEVGKQ